MAVLPVVKFGAPILRKQTAPVDNPGDVEQYLDDMFETMYEEGGLGLAANQVGWDMNFMVVDISQEDEENDEFPRVFINPEIIDSSGSSDLEEGCLSIPEIRATITRPESITVRYVDEDGEATEETFGGLIARVIQHEVDHLKGVYFTDYLTPAKRTMINKRLTEIAENGVPSTGIILS